MSFKVVIAGRRITSDDLEDFPNTFIQSIQNVLNQCQETGLFVKLSYGS